MNKKEINKAVEIIEKYTVYRNTELTNKTGLFIAVNDPDHKPFEISHKKIMDLGKTVKKYKVKSNKVYCCKCGKNSTILNDSELKFSDKWICRECYNNEENNL